jgi:hypothetical protein
MNYRILFLLIVSAQLLLAERPAREFIEEKTKFTTAGHPKAKGLVMTIEYPSSWAAQEGENPNVVQKFVRPNSPVMAAIVIWPLPPGTKISEQFFTPSEVRKNLPEGATFIDVKPTKINGLPAGIVEFSMLVETAGMTIDTRLVSFIFVHDTMMVHLQCKVGVPAEQSASLPQRMSEFRPVFALMANSIVLGER